MLFRSDRKSTRLNSSHTLISYAVFCLKKKRKQEPAVECGETSSRRQASLVLYAATHFFAPSPRARALRGFRFACLLLRFFFLNETAPPEFSLLPPPAAFPI